MQIEQFRPCFIRRLFAVNFRRRSVTARLCVGEGRMWFPFEKYHRKWKGEKILLVSNIDLKQWNKSKIDEEKL